MCLRSLIGSTGMADVSGADSRDPHDGRSWWSSSTIDDMPTPSLAQAFFDRIMTAADKIVFLTALADPTTHCFEEEWLEFKRAPDIMGDDVKQNWSKALSGFAN